MDEFKEALHNPLVYAFSVIFRLGLVVMFLYFFLVALAIMGDGFKAVGGKQSGELFTSINNPIAGLMVGILATVLVQSSSTTTSVVVSATAAGVLDVQTGVPIIMGANIGTSVTNTIVSIGFANDRSNYERAFSGATVHDVFNLLGVIIWLPLDQIVNAINAGNGGLFATIVAAIVPEDLESSEDEDLFIKKAVASISKKVISINKDIIKDYATGEPRSFCANNPGRIYPMKEKKGCLDSVIPIPEFSSKLPVDNPNYLLTGFAEKFKFNCQCNASAISKTGIGEVTGTEYTAYKSGKGKCKSSIVWDFCVVDDYDPALLVQDFGVNSSDYVMRSTLHAQTFFDNARTVKAGELFAAGYSDVEIGVISLVISVIILIVCLVGIVKTMQSIIAGPAEKYVVAGLNYNFPGGDYLAILIGAGLTLLVQSSSITTSILTPMVGIGTLTLENMFPFTVGANLGTTGTGLIAGFADGDKDGIQIALCHFFFNLFNAILWYPLPVLRNVPLNIARFLGKLAAAYRLFPVIYILLVFVTYPLLFLALSVLLESGDVGQIAGGGILLILLLGLHGFFIYWYHILEGKNRVKVFIEARTSGEDSQTPNQGKPANEEDEEDEKIESKSSDASVQIA